MHEAGHTVAVVCVKIHHMELTKWTYYVNKIAYAYIVILWRNVLCVKKGLCVDNEVPLVMTVNQASRKPHYRVFSGSEEACTDCCFVLDFKYMKTFSASLIGDQNNEEDICVFFLFFKKTYI